MKRNKEIVYLILVLIPIFQPKLFTQYKITTNIYIALNIIEFFIFTIIFLKKELKVSKPFMIWIIYRVYLLLISIINNNFSGILQWGYLSLMVTNLFCIFEISKERKNQDKILHSISILGNILLIINFVTLIVFERGIIRSTFYNGTDGDYYLLGIKTQFVTMMFPTVVCSILYYLKEKNKSSQINMFIATIVSILTILYKNISTPLIGLIIVTFLLVARKLFKIKFNFKWIFLFIIVLQILIVFFNISTYFSDFFTIVLRKDATLSARTYIWKSAKMLLSEESILKLVFGNGIVKGNEFVPYSGSYWQPHNQLLVWLYSGGILGTIIINYLLMQLINIKKRNSSYYIIGIFAIVELFLSVTETYFDVAVCYVPFIVIYYCFKDFSRYRSNDLEEINK